MDDVAETYRRCGAAIFRRCLKLLGDPGRAQDATQEVFVRLIRHGGRLEPREGYLGWTYRVATNYCLNLLRDEARLVLREPSALPALPDLSLAPWRSDRGATWTATQLAKDLGTYGGGQTVAVDGPGVHVAYADANGGVGAGPTLYIRSADNGETWSKPIVIGESTPSSSLQARVQLSAADGRVFACWQREPSVAGGALPADRLGYNTSSDKGLTWAMARVLPEDRGVERNHQHIWMAPGGGCTSYGGTATAATPSTTPPATSSRPTTARPGGRAPSPSTPPAPRAAPTRGRSPRTAPPSTS